MSEKYVRRLSLLEGVSYLALLFIAMPLKYWADFAFAVRIAGMIHGALFLALAAGLLWLWLRHKWSWWHSALVLLVALLPFGAVWLEWRWRALGTPFTNSPGTPPPYGGRNPVRSAPSSDEKTSL